MRSIVAAVVLIALPAGAHAQLVPRSPPDSPSLPGFLEIHADPVPATVRHDLDATFDRIDYRVRNGELSKQEARALRREARLTARLASRYAYDGLTDGERRELETRAAVVRGQAESPVVRR